VQPGPPPQAASGRLVIPELRPERPGARPDRGPEHLKTSPRPSFLHSTEGTEAANDLISAAW
jgi:hypothetical protein